ncbi:deoxyribodipyrimidine photo-lyase [Flavobacterium sp. P21]|uniref:deoxyribodipyrimidine photo-lyase n=1 Tax=Flavobacterium sp. P21 TaxID=3423948 RepID=UPI003D672963
MQNPTGKSHHCWIGEQKKVNIIWFKRDLRLTDHEPLFLAQQENTPLLLFYFFEPSVMAHDDSDVRHWRFVYESLQEMQSRLKTVQTQIYCFHNEVHTVFEQTWSAL